ncbi:short chain dehydrogenase family protein [Mycobacterium intracellulare]|nr:short chain dehydrogenase family protein [Mycobacterium intracellulare]
MRVFVTGASGGIGSAVVTELLAAGHQVVGLARSEAAAATIGGLGGEPLRGDVTDLDVLREAAGDADGVAYLAFSHDFAGTGDVIGDAIGDEARAVAALGDALVDTGKPLVLASGTPRWPVAPAPRTTRSTPRGRWPGVAAPDKPSSTWPSAVSDRPWCGCRGRSMMPADATASPAC